MNSDGVNDAAIGRCFSCIFRRSSSGDATLRRASGGNSIVDADVDDDDEEDVTEKHDATATRAESTESLSSSRRMCFFMLFVASVGSRTQLFSTYAGRRVGSLLEHAKTACKMLSHFWRVEGGGRRGPKFWGS